MSRCWLGHGQRVDAFPALWICGWKIQAWANSERKTISLLDNIFVYWSCSLHCSQEIPKAPICTINRVIKMLLIKQQLFILILIVLIIMVVEQWRQAEIMFSSIKTVLWNLSQSNLFNHFLLVNPDLFQTRFQSSTLPTYTNTLANLWPFSTVQVHKVICPTVDRISHSALGRAKALICARSPVEVAVASAFPLPLDATPCEGTPVTQRSGTYRNARNAVCH